MAATSFPIVASGRSSTVRKRMQDLPMSAFLPSALKAALSAAAWAGAW